MGDAPMLVTAEEFPHGLRCIDCNKPLPPGAFYTERLLSVGEASVIEEIVCLDCYDAAPEGKGPRNGCTND